MGWAAGRDEAETATRYALHELNGFSNWMPSLYRVHSQTVIDVVVKEIDHELATEGSGSERLDVLQDASWRSSWM